MSSTPPNPLNAKTLSTICRNASASTHLAQIAATASCCGPTAARLNEQPASAHTGAPLSPSRRNRAPAGNAHRTTSASRSRLHSRSPPN